MKRYLIAAAIFAATPFALAQGMTGMDKSKDKTSADTKSMPTTSEAGRVHKGTGVVKSVDPNKKSVMLAHEAVASLNWPSMTMAFKADDPKLIEKLKPGNKVEFEFTQKGSDYVITSVK